MITSREPSPVGYVCSSCHVAVDLLTGAWRWNGSEWEHAHGQAGHFVADRLRVFTDGTDTVVAESVEAVREILKRQCGYGDDDLATAFVELPANAELTIWIEDRDNRQTRTVGEWIAMSGRGLLCSTEF